MSRIRLGGLAVTAALCASLGACATVEDTTHIPYVAHGAPAPNVANIRVSVTATDARVTNRARISTKKNGYGMDMAAIRSADDIADVVKKALSDEVKARGYQLAPDGVAVDAQVKTFYTDFKTGMFAGAAQGAVDLTVTVRRGGVQVYARDVHGAKSKSVEIFSGSNAAAALSLALGDAIDKLFADPAFTAALAGQG